MKTYEYIRAELDMGDLSELNRLSSTGWRVVGIVPGKSFNAASEEFIDVSYALLERELPEKQYIDTTPLQIDPYIPEHWWVHTPPLEPKGRAESERTPGLPRSEKEHDTGDPWAYGIDQQ